MAYESIHLLTDTPAGNFNDQPGGILNGTTFRFTAAGQVDGIRWFSGSTIDPAATYVVALYELSNNSAGTLVASKSILGSAVTASQWQDTMFDAPVSVAANKYYRAVRLSPNNYYVATDGVFSTDKVSAGGHVVGLQDDTDPLGLFNVGNGMYMYSNVMAVPTENFGTPDYFVDVLYSTGGSTTPVSSNADIRWRVRGRVQADADVRWRVLNRVTADMDARWRVVNRITADADLRWRIANRVQTDLDARWRVLGGVTKDADLRWRTFGLVASDADLRWRVGGQVASDATLLWRVHGVDSPIPLPADLAVDLGDALQVHASIDQMVVTADLNGPRFVVDLEGL